MQIVDSDIHPWLDTIGTLFPYVSNNWRRRLESRGDLSFLVTLPGRAPRFVDLLRPDAVPPTGGMPGSDPSWVATHHLDKHGIDAGLLLPLQPAMLESWTNLDEAAVLATASNDYFAECWLSVEPRFWLAMAVGPHDPELAAKEIRRFGQHPQVAAVFLPVIPRLMGHRHFYPIYEAAQELDLAIITHPTGTEGNYAGSVNFAGGTPPSKPEQGSLIGQFAESNMVNLIFEGVFERFPRLHVVFIEYGYSWVGPMLWHMDAYWKAARRVTPWVRRAPSEYVRDHIRFTSQMTLEVPSQHELDAVLEMMSAERTLIYSSDYPHWDEEENLSLLFRGTPEEIRQRIFSESALETYPRIRLDRVPVSADGVPIEAGA